MPWFGSRPFGLADSQPRRQVSCSLPCLLPSVNVSHRQIAPGAALLCAAAVRFGGLGKESIWLDEATSLITAGMAPRSVIAWAAADVHPPLYYLVLHFWLQLGETEFAIRALSAVLGVLTVAVAYGLARQLLGHKSGVLSAFLLGLAPLHVWYSQEARMYVMVTFLSLLATRLLLLALVHDAQAGMGSGRAARRFWLGYVIASALALYTHYFALLAWFFANLYALYWLHQRQFERCRRWVLAQVIVVGLFLPWTPVLLHQVTTGGGGWVERSIGRPPLYALLDTWLSFSVGVDSSLYPFLLRRLAYVAFGVCMAVALYRLARPNAVGQPKRSVRGGLLFCVIYAGLPLLVVWVLSQFKPMYSTRYLLVFLPGYCMIIAAGIGMLPRRGARLVTVLALAATLLVGNWNAWRVEQNADWRGVASYVVDHARTGDAVLFSPRWNVKPFEYYNRGRVDVNMDLPIPVTLEEAERVVSELSKTHSRVWFVWDEGHYSDMTGIAKRALDAQYAQSQEVGFRGVDHVLLYVPKTGRGS